MYVDMIITILSMFDAYVCMDHCQLFFGFMSSSLSVHNTCPPAHLGTYYWQYHGRTTLPGEAGNALHRRNKVGGANFLLRIAIVPSAVGI